VTGSLRLLLVRHGESTWNVQGRVQGQTSHVPLTDLGRTQARDVAARLAAMSVQRLHTSDLLRAVQTADAIARTTGLETRPDRRLRERGYGLLEGRPSHAVPMLGSRDACAPPGGESFQDVVRRVGGLLEECLAEAAHDDLDGVVLVTHGDTIAAALCWLGRDPGNDPSNGSVTTVRVKVAGRRVSA
jgi:broad specificity phosphatase PhoE